MATLSEIRGKQLARGKMPYDKIPNKWAAAQYAKLEPLRIDLQNAIKAGKRVRQSCSKKSISFLPMKR